MSDDPRDDPFDMTQGIETLAEGAKTVRQLFVSYTLAGFTDAQAMQIVCAILRAAVTATAGGKS